ncbi:MAG: septation protein A [Legionellaceae bacterium]|nr:septation protein A [Legionellaceae bacterium]
MRLLFDFFPMMIFFIAYKCLGIYKATALAIATSFFQLLYHRIKNQRIETMHLAGFLMILVLGGATLWFHNPWFVKWKPTGIYWCMALLIAGSRWIGRKPIIQKMMEENIVLPQEIWFRLNTAWALFFGLMGLLNVYIAYCYSTDTWVLFKLFGGVGLTVVFVLLQAMYLTRHFVADDNIEKNPL